MKLLHLKWKLLPLVVAAFIIPLPLIQTKWDHHKISQETAKASSALTKSSNEISSPRIEGLPVRILIPSLNIDLPVASQKYSNEMKTWPVTDATANFAVESVPINNKNGQSLIYGHNNNKVFGPILSLSQGSVALVYTDNGHIFEYKFVSGMDVAPKNTELVSNSTESSPRLNLMTCDGAFYEFRRILAFDLLRST